MKKLVLSVAAILGLSVAGAMAQSNVKFKVDITDYLNNGGAINAVVSIAGSFTSHGAAAIADWSPGAGAMTDLGSNVWSIDVAFDGTATDSLNWKYVSGSDWPDGDEGNEWLVFDATCIRPTDNNNRKALIPATGNWEYSSKWAECGALLPQTSTLTLVNGLDVNVGPNPASSTLNVRFAGSANSVIRMTGLDGKVVRTITVAQNGTTDHTVNVSDLRAGLYYVTVSDAGRTFKAPVVVAN